MPVFREEPLKTFVEVPVEKVKNLSYNGGYWIVFEPGRGYQWARYWNGSNAWQSNITLEEIEVTHVLMPLEALL